MSKDKCPCWDNGLREGMTYEELIEEIVKPEKYCTSQKERNGGQSWICPQLDVELRRADLERQRKEAYYKRTGKSPSEASNLSRGGKRIPKNFKPRSKV